MVLEHTETKENVTVAHGYRRFAHSIDVPITILKISGLSSGLKINILEEEEKEGEKETRAYGC